MRKIGVFGGTFNPPHFGHFQAARQAVELLHLDRLLLVPTHEPPHKTLPREGAGPQERLAMAEQLADALLLPDVAEVSDLELRRGGASYTAETLDALAREYPGDRLILLMGSDMFLTLHQWREPEKILTLAEVCAFARESGEDWTALERQREHLRSRYGGDIRLLALPQVVEVSSTRLRQLLAAGEGEELLLPCVWGYILQNGLYGTRVDLKNLTERQLRACSLSMVRAKRFAHILGTEETAVRLAERWGANQIHAQRAAILHDCTKYWEAEEHLALCARYEVETDELERSAVKLLHAKTGACMARHVFGEPDEVFSAIFWHTTAKPDMTTLEKTLYLADYIEPNRAFDGVERLRRLAFEDLDAALLLGVETSMQEMRERDRPIHPATREAGQWLRDRGVTTEE